MQVLNAAGIKYYYITQRQSEFLVGLLEGKHPNHLQISLELTAKPHAPAASIEEFPREEFPLLTYGTHKATRWKGAKYSRLGRGAAFSTSQTRLTPMTEAGSQH